MQWRLKKAHAKTTSLEVDNTHTLLRTDTERERDLRLVDRVRSLRRNATELRLLLSRDLWQPVALSFFTVTGRVAIVRSSLNL